MTIKLGNVTVNGGQITLDAPGGFNTFTAIRLANYTSYVLVLRNMSGMTASTEYLLPSQQMVYHTENVSTIPTIEGIPTGGLTTVPTVLAEWSDDPLNDFIGTYPTTISSINVPPALGLGTLLNAGEWLVIPADPLRAWLILENTSVLVTPGVDVKVFWAGADVLSSFPTAPPPGCPYLPVGQSVAIDTTGAIAIYIEVTGTPGPSDTTSAGWTYGTFGAPTFPIPIPG